jgi:hypothetical protein
MEFSKEFNGIRNLAKKRRDWIEFGI